MSKLKDFRVWMATKILGSIGLIYNNQLHKLEFQPGATNTYVVNNEIKDHKNTDAKILDMSGPDDRG